MGLGGLLGKQLAIYTLPGYGEIMTSDRDGERPSRGPASRLAMFAFLLAAVFGGGLAIGRAVGPIDEPTTTEPTVGVPAPDPRPVPAPTPTTGHGEHP